MRLRAEHESPLCRAAHGIQHPRGEYVGRVAPRVHAQSPARHQPSEREGDCHVQENWSAGLARPGLRLLVWTGERLRPLRLSEGNHGLRPVRPERSSRAAANLRQQRQFKFGASARPLLAMRLKRSTRIIGTVSCFAGWLGAGMLATPRRCKSHGGSSFSGRYSCVWGWPTTGWRPGSWSNPS